MRSFLGILETVTSGDFSCAFDCYYCPNQKVIQEVCKRRTIFTRAAEQFDIVKQF